MTPINEIKSYLQQCRQDYQEAIDAIDLAIESLQGRSMNQPTPEQTKPSKPTAIYQRKIGLVSEKQCIECGRIYQPTSNGQKRCQECIVKKKSTDRSG